MYKKLVLEEQSILLFKVIVEGTGAEVCVVTIRTTIFVNVFEILRSSGPNRATTQI